MGNESAQILLSNLIRGEETVKEKLVYLFKNTGLLIVSNFSSKILVFLLVPLYTSVLTTEEYGSYDLLYNTMLMLLPIITANITDSVMRFSINTNTDNQKKTLAVGIKYILLSIILLTAGMLIFTALTKSEMMRNYLIPFLLLYICYVLQQLLIQFAKGIDDIKGLSISGVLGTAVMLCGNLYFLLVAKMGLYGYFYANILASFVPALFLFIHGRMYHFLPRPKALFTQTEYEKEMLRYCLPLTVNTMSWNINNVSNRYVITWICGIAANGIFSVAYKIPAILNAIQVIFIQAWQLSAIREYDPEDKDGFFSGTYQGCHTVMVILCSSIIVGSRILAHILFAKNFYAAWEYVPALLIYIVFNTLSGTIGTVFSAVKDPIAPTKSGVIGAIANVVLDIILVFAIGLHGASIATVISSIVIWAMRMQYAKKYIVLKINLRRHILEYALLIVQALLMTLITHPIGYCAQLFVWGLLVVLNVKQLKKVIKK